MKHHECSGQQWSSIVIAHANATRKRMYIEIDHVLEEQRHANERHRVAVDSNVLHNKRRSPIVRSCSKIILLRGNVYVGVCV